METNSWVYIGYPPTVKELQTIGKKLPQDFANLMAHSKREDTRFENYF
jgi:hypothetical protein